jgi:hypothetical protein
MAFRRDYEELTVITKIYDLILWSCHHTSTFPRNHRFVLGEGIERNLYDLPETLLPSSTITLASELPPGNPLRPSTKAICTAFHVFPGASKIGPDSALGHFPVLRWCESAHSRMLLRFKGQEIGPVAQSAVLCEELSQRRTTRQPSATLIERRLDSCPRFAGCVHDWA